MPIVSVRSTLSVWMVCCVGVCAAQGWTYEGAEIEKRNAAAGFVFSRQATLAMLREECVPFLPDGAAAAVASNWDERNKADLQVVYAWVNQYLSHLKESAAGQHQRASRELLVSTSNAVRQSALVYFKRQPPSAALCAPALNTFVLPELDVQNMARNPGYEQFAEFPETLKRMRDDQQLVARVKDGAMATSRTTYSLVASAEAAQAARERGDGAAAMAIYSGMAKRGESTAAQTLGVMHLTGALVPKNELQAYRWFYATWSLANPEGLNALGVLLKEGRGVPSNPRLAYAAFVLSSVIARDPSLQDRARQNLRALADQISSADREAIACITLEAFDQQLRVHAGPTDLVPGKALVQGQRRLGQVLPSLTGATPSCS